MSLARRPCGTVRENVGTTRHGVGERWSSMVYPDRCLSDRAALLEPLSPCMPGGRPPTERLKPRGRSSERGGLLDAETVEQALVRAPPAADVDEQVQVDLRA